MDSEHELLEQLDMHLDRPSSHWLFGAGISFGAGIPLMHQLTKEVLDRTKGEELLPEWFAEAQKSLSKHSHIEHILSQLGDMATMAARSDEDQLTIFGIKVPRTEIIDLHNIFRRHIAEIVRWGLREEKDGTVTKGSSSEPVVVVDDHLDFITALCSRRLGGLEKRRSAVNIFTTNYDTLLEDAIALARIPYSDGFCGGAVAFYEPSLASVDTGSRIVLTKLHGSIDWTVDSAGHIVRRRVSDAYPESAEQIMIYPQATKYVAARRDPFAQQFDHFRKVLSRGASDGSTLGICGYSFGDEHINEEIELAMMQPDNKTTILAFIKDITDIPSNLQAWQKSPWQERLYIISSTGIAQGDAEAKSLPKEEPHNWWTFQGITRVLTDGFAGACQ